MALVPAAALAASLAIIVVVPATPPLVAAALPLPVAPPPLPFVAPPPFFALPPLVRPPHGISVDSPGMGGGLLVPPVLSAAPAIVPATAPVVISA